MALSAFTLKRDGKDITGVTMVLQQDQHPVPVDVVIDGDDTFTAIDSFAFTQSGTVLDTGLSVLTDPATVANGTKVRILFNPRVYRPGQTFLGTLKFTKDQVQAEIDITLVVKPSAYRKRG